MDFSKFDPSKMSPQQLRNMINMFNSLPEEQLRGIMKSMGLNMEPSQLKSFIELMKNSSDDDLEKLKNQYKSGKVNMNDFSAPQSSVTKPFEEKLKQAKTLMDENKFVESCNTSNEVLEQAKALTVEDKDKESIKDIIGKAYEQLTLSRFKMEDYDTTIAECLKCIDDTPVFSVINRMGIAYFKKGRHVKARDAFEKAKKLFPNETDAIAEKYLKMALEEIENY